MRTLLLSAVLLVILALSLGLASRDTPPVGVEQAVAEEVHAQQERGAALYAEHCAVCHGKKRQGLSEARLAFPEDHQRCEGCHRPNNPPQMALSAMTSRRAFSVGEAPALVGEGALTNFPNAEVLRSYISATMPRPFPGTLSEQEYNDLSVFLFHSKTP